MPAKMTITTRSPPPSPPSPVDEGYHSGDRVDVYVLAPVGTLLGIACVITGLRIYWRLRPSRRIGADDYTIVFALALTIAWYGIDAAMYSYGRGLEGFSPDPWTMGPLEVADGVLWVWALNVIRISVALMLLRLKSSPPWKLTMWTIIGVQACMLIVGTTMHLVRCQPISARWAPTHASQCMQPSRFMAYGYVYSAFTIASDLILSLLPATFIRSLRRPFHEKFLIGCLMAAGLGATAIAVARLLLIMGYAGNKGGPKVNAEQDTLWGLELTIGVLAPSLPTLKAPVHRLLQSWGLLGSESDSDTSPESFFNRRTTSSHRTRQRRPWAAVVRELVPGIQGRSTRSHTTIGLSQEQIPKV